MTRTWLTEKLYPRRWQVIGVCAVLGLLLAAAALQYKREASHNDQVNARQDVADARAAVDREELRAAVARLRRVVVRLRRVEHPTLVQVQRLIGRAFGLSRPEVRQLGRSFRESASPPSPGVLVPLTPQPPRSRPDRPATGRPPSEPAPPVLPAPPTPRPPSVPELPEIVEGVCGMLRPLVPVC